MVSALSFDYPDNVSAGLYDYAHAYDRPFTYYFKGTIRWNEVLQCPWKSKCNNNPSMLTPLLLDTFWRISLHVTEDAIAKLYLT